MLQPPRKIAIVGPESTGKSTLAHQLAEALHTNWVEEYAREYLEQLERPYTQRDLLEIARGQLEKEREALGQANHFLICDTNLLVIKIWSLYKYGKVEHELSKLMDLQSYDIHLLTDIDLPWTYDPMRENPSLDERRELFDMYEDELKKNGLHYSIVQGSEEARLQAALKIIEKVR